MGQTPVNANVAQYCGVDSSSQDEHVGLIRGDHSSTTNSAFTSASPTTNAFAPSSALPLGTYNLDAPTSGLFDLLCIASPRTTNEIRLGAYYSQPLNSVSTPTGINIAVAVPSLTTIPEQNYFIVVDIDGKTLRLKQVSIDGKELDSFRITK